jgi:hypothetical protein
VQVHVYLPEETLKLLESDLALGDASEMHVLLKHSVGQESELVAITKCAGSSPHIPSQHPSEVSYVWQGGIVDNVPRGDVM